MPFTMPSLRGAGGAPPAAQHAAEERAAQPPADEAREPPSGTWPSAAARRGLYSDVPVDRVGGRLGAQAWFLSAHGGEGAAGLPQELLISYSVLLPYW